MEQNTNSDYPSDGGGGGGSWMGGSRGRGGGTHNPRNPKPKPYDKNNQPRAKRKCGICGQEGIE